MSLSSGRAHRAHVASCLEIVLALLAAAAPYPPQLFAQTTPATDSVGDPMPPGARLRLGTLRFRHPGNVAELALSPDEKTVLTLGDFVIAWDTATGKERWRGNLSDQRIDVPAASYGMRWFAFAADSDRLYSPGKYDTFSVWDMATGRREVISLKDELSFAVGNLPVAATRMAGKSIDVSRDGKMLAIGQGGGLKVCDRDGKLLHAIETRPVDRGDEMNRNRLLAGGGEYSLARFSPDDKLLAIASSDAPEEIVIVEAATGRLPRRISLKARCVRFAFSPNGKQIAATERDGAIRFYDVETTKPLWSYVIPLNNPYENYTSAIAFAPDGNTVAAAATDYRIYLIDVPTGREVGKLVGHVWYPWALAFTADSNTLYSSGWDGAIRRWDLRTKKQMDLPAGVRGSETVAASPDGRTIAYSDEAGTVRLVSAADGTERRQLKLLGTQYTQLMFSPDGRKLAGGGTLGDNVHVAIWNLPSGELAERFDWPKGRDPHSDVESLAFSPDGKRLAAAVFRQDAVYLWDLTTSEQIAKIEHNDVYGLSFKPDGRTLATAGWDSAVRLWDATSGASTGVADVKFLASAQAKPNPTVDFKKWRDDWRAYTVCYAPFGPFAATVHINKLAMIWNAAEMSPVRVIEKPVGSNHGALAFSPDGLWLAAGDTSGRVSLWDPWSGTEVLDVGKHEDRIYTVGFGRDSRTLTSGAGSVCYQWDLRPRTPLPKKELNALWSDLAGNNGPAAYQAMWALADSPDESVMLVSDKLKPATMELDTSGKGDQWRTTQRAVSLLAQIGTPNAEWLLRELAEQQQNTELARLAAAALNRIAPRD